MSDPPPSGGGVSDTGAAFLQDAERRQVTVVFCDLVDSSRLALRLDPEDLRDVLRAYQALCVEAVRRHDGFVAQYLGDGLVAYFGHPVAREDAAEQAVRAAREMIEAVRTIVADGAPLEARAGIATGLAVVGDVLGAGASRQTAISGPVATLAARVQAEARPGDVVIAESTRKLAFSAFELSDLGEQTLKGVDQPVRLWRAGGERQHDTRFEAVRDGPTAIVGREAEREALAEAWRLTALGQPQAVLVRGEAGIGKSTLLSAFLESVTTDFTVIAMQCSSRHVQSPLHPVISRMQRILGWVEGVSETEREERLAAFVNRRGLPETASLLREFVAPPSASDGAISAPVAQQRRRDTLTALIDLMRRNAAIDPVIVLIEDIHWADPSTHEFLGQILSSVTNDRVMLLASSRPDTARPWMRIKPLTTLDLDRLPPDQARRVIQQTGGEIAQSLIEQILDRSDGVPLYLKELSRAVAVDGEARPAGGIPLSLHDGLAARLDRLGAAKLTAQVAAVLGRTFAPDAVAEISQRNPAAVSADLFTLEAANLIAPVDRAARREYAFTHALLQEAAYDGLLRNTRRTLHARAALALESLRPDLVASEPEILAQHHELGGDALTAARYWLMAGQRAQSRAANLEAIAHLGRGLDAIAQARDWTDGEALEFQLQLALGQAAYVLHGPAHPRTVEAYARAQALVEAVGDPDLRGRVLYGIFSGYHFASKLDLAEPPARLMLDLALRENRRGDLCQGYRMLGYVAFFRGQHVQAMEHFTALAAAYHPEDHGARAYHFGADCLVAGQGFHAVSEAVIGDPAAAIARADRNLDLARTLQHPASLGWAYAAACYVRYFADDPQGALILAEEGAAYCQAHNVGSWQPHCRLFALWARGRLEGRKDRVAQVREAMATAAAGNKLGLCLFRLVLAELLLRQGDAEDAFNEAELALEDVNQTGQRVFEPQALLIRAQCLAALDGDRDAAREAFAVAEAIAHAAGARPAERQAREALAALGA
jgi:class 3 adenylate cyclase